MTHIHIHVFLCFFIIHLPICPSTHMSTELYMSIVYPSYMCVYVHTHIHICTYVCAYIYSSIHMSIHPSIHPFIHPRSHSLILLSILTSTIYHSTTYPSVLARIQMDLSGFLPGPLLQVGCGIWENCDGPSLMQQEVHCATTSPLQVCEPSLSGNITAFALKARVVYPINQKFRVSTPSCILLEKFTPHCAGLHGDPRAWIRCGFPSCLKVSLCAESSIIEGEAESIECPVDSVLARSVWRRAGILLLR